MKTLDTKSIVAQMSNQSELAGSSSSPFGLSGSKSFDFGLRSDEEKLRERLRAGLRTAKRLRGKVNDDDVQFGNEEELIGASFQLAMDQERKIGSKYPNVCVPEIVAAMSFPVKMKEGENSYEANNPTWNLDVEDTFTIHSIAFAASIWMLDQLLEVDDIMDWEVRLKSSLSLDSVANGMRWPIDIEARDSIHSLYMIGAMAAVIGRKGIAGIETADCSSDDEVADNEFCFSAPKRKNELSKIYDRAIKRIGNNVVEYAIDYVKRVVDSAIEAAVFFFDVLEKDDYNQLNGVLSAQYRFEHALAFISNAWMFSANGGATKTEETRMLKDFHIEDPYLFLFGLTHMSYVSDPYCNNRRLLIDLAWLAVNELPWLCTRKVCLQVLAGNEFRYEDGEVLPDEYAMFSFDSKDGRHYRFNHTQIVYAMTGQILKRKASYRTMESESLKYPVKKLPVEYIDTRLKSDCSDSMMPRTEFDDVIMQMLRSSSEYGSKFAELMQTKSAKDIVEATTNGSREFEETSTLLEDCKKKIDLLQEAVKTAQAEATEAKQDLALNRIKLKNAQEDIRTLRQNGANASQQLAEMQSKYRREHMELVNLREKIFSFENEDQASGDADESNTESNVKFPYTMKKKVSVFGGHNAWSKQIRAMFTNVRFTDRDKIPDADLVRYSDAVWIQTNAISHAYCKKVVNVATNSGVEIRYFKAGRPTACALELVDFDSED